MERTNRIQLGGKQAETLAISILGRTHPHATDFWDGNWLSSRVQVAAGGFRGTVTGDLRAEELAGFHDELERLHRTLEGEAVFRTMEEWLSVTVTGDGRGHMETRCTVRDAPGIGNTLEFTLRLDQSYLPPVLRDLQSLVATYPVLGKP